MIEDLIQMYQHGEISGYQLAVECLQAIDPRRPELVLQSLPAEIHDSILAYAERYNPRKSKPKARILPAEDQVEAAKSWIERNRLKLLEIA